MLKHTGATIALLTEGMGGRLKTKHGQLVPLTQRRTKAQLKKRQEKRMARRTVAEQLVSRQDQFFRLVAAELYRRTFWGRVQTIKVRVKGLFAGKKAA